MTTLLKAIRDKLAAELSYLRGVYVVPDLMVFPDAPGFPIVCVMDAGEDPPGGELGGRMEHLHVSIGIYQAIAGTAEESVVGDGVAKGVLDIADDILAELRGVTFSPAYQAPFQGAKSKTRALESADYEGFVAFKSIELEYLREVIS